MTVLALIAMVCGPATDAASKACYKQMLACYERQKYSAVYVSDERAMRLCLLEM